MNAKTYPVPVKLSPTSIVAALSCPRKYRYRYVDKLEPRRISSRFAFGKAVHRAIEVAYAYRNTPLEADDVASAFSQHFTALDAQGINYHKKETLEALDAKGRALVALWWETFREDVLAAEVLAVEARLSHEVDVGLTVRGYPDIIEERDGRLYIGDHKTLAGWGPSYEVMAAHSVQLTLYGYLYHQQHGVYPDVYYWTVLKKTKVPETFRFYTTRTPAAVDAFGEYAVEVTAAIRFWAERGTYLRNLCRDCNMCEFAALCQGVEGAEEFYKTRGERVKETEDEIETD